MLGEHYHESFPKNLVGQASRSHVLVHSDICGLMIILSVGGAKYLLTFMDDFSHFLWIYTIQFKDEALEKFKELNPCWKITTIRRSNISGLIMEINTLVMAFLHFLHLMAFGRSLVPHQDEVVHRRSRTILEMTCCMFHSQQMESKFMGRSSLLCSSYHQYNAYLNFLTYDSF